MLLRRLFAGLLVLGFLAGVAVPALGQKDDKKDDKKDKKEEKKEEKKKGTELSWKFEKGKPFYQTMTTETTQKMKVMNNDVVQTQKQTFYFKWTPTEVDDDKAVIEQEITGVKMEIDIGGTKINYDSTAEEKGQQNPLGDFFKALKGSKFTITLNRKTYAVDKMTGRDEFIKKLVAANPGMRQLLDTILSEKALKEMAEPTFAVVPGPSKPVSYGDKWDKTTELDMGPIGKYKNVYNYQYEKTNDKKLEQIKVETKLEYTQPDDKANQGGLPFKIKSAKLKSSSPVGQVFFDKDKGRVVSSEMKLSLSGDLSIEIGGQTTTVNLDQQQTSRTETSDEDPLAKKK